MKIFKEKLYPDIFSGFKYDKKLYSAISKFQKIEVFEQPTMGKVLVLDDIVQLATHDEFILHETLAYWPFYVKKDIKNILIIGGGDLGLAIKLLKVNQNFHITLVDIDKKVTEISLKYIFKSSSNVLKDSRLKIINDDAYEYIKTEKKIYDLIYIDSTDDFGVGSALYKNEFIIGLKNILAHEGILMRLSGSYFLQHKSFLKINKESKKIFGEESVGNLYLPLNMYQGGVYTINVCIKSKEFSFKNVVNFKSPGKWYDSLKHISVSTFF